MKSNFFKIVLPAFALMLAITASLAFTPAENNAEGVDDVFEGYYMSDEANPCLDINLIVCQEDPTAYLCTVLVDSAKEQIWKERQTTSSDCTVILFQSSILKNGTIAIAAP